MLEFEVTSVLSRSVASALISCVPLIATEGFGNAGGAVAVMTTDAETCRGPPAQRGKNGLEIAWVGDYASKPSSSVTLNR